MKTTELIARLQQLQKNVPFDADVVTGDDWMPALLKGVRHEPPATYLEFEEFDDQDEIADNQLSEAQEVQMRTYIAHLLLRFQNRQDTDAETIRKLFELVVLFKESSPQAAIVQMNKK
jgi:predicted dienelactone hydrolase